MSIEIVALRTVFPDVTFDNIGKYIAMQEGTYLMSTSWHTTNIGSSNSVFAISEDNKIHVISRGDLIKKTSDSNLLISGYTHNVTQPFKYLAICPKHYSIGPYG